MRKIIIAIVLSLDLLFLAGAAHAAAAPVKEYEDGENMVREYVFYSDIETDPAFATAKKNIRIDGKEYKLIDTSFEKIGEAVTVTKRIETRNRSRYPKTVKATNYLGEEVTLTAHSDISWKKKLLPAATETVVYEDMRIIPEKKKITKNGKEVSASKSSVSQSSRSENFTAPAAFYGSKDARYTFNGKYVSLGDSPMWDGYEKDILAYFNDRSITGISSGRWNGGMTKDAQGRDVRYATFTGTRNVPIYTVTYTEDEASRTSYTADITYTDPAETGKYVIKAVCTYEPDSNILRMILYGAGILAIAAGIAAVIAYLASRKRLRKQE